MNNDAQIISGLFLAFATAVLIGFSVYPLIIKISFKKRFFKGSNKRTIHGKFVSTFGGIGITFGFLMGSVIGIIILGHYAESNKFYFLIFPVLLIFLLGVWDDLVQISAYSKVMIQIICGLMMTIFLDVRINNLDGLFGVDQLSLFWSVSATFLFILTIINSINLLDGIDGFAGSFVVLVGIATAVFGLDAGRFDLVILTLACLGSLLPFLFYNMYYKRKLFMGDSGSMVLGLLTAYFILEVFQFQGNGLNSITRSPIVIAFALGALPLIDTTRVIILRLSRGQGPFTADKSHIHHQYIDMGLSHNQATYIVMQLTLALWIFGLSMPDIDVHKELGIIIILALVLYIGPIVLFRLKNHYYDNNGN